MLPIGDNGQSITNVKYINEPAHAIMELFVFRKNNFLTRMSSHSMGLDVDCFNTLCANSEGSGDTAPMRRLVTYVIITLFS